MPSYIIVIETKEEESIASLTDAVGDSVQDFNSVDAIDPDYLAVDTSREATDEDGLTIMFQRTE